jgi:hypothetical protein
MLDKELSERQIQMAGNLLSQAIKNKKYIHPLDMRHAAVILYDLIRMGYYVGEDTVGEIIESSDDHYSDTIIGQLQIMANAFSDLVNGLVDPTSKRLQESDLE